MMIPEQGVIYSIAADRLIFAHGLPHQFRAHDPDQAAPQFYRPGFFFENERPWSVYPQHQVFSRQDILSLCEGFFSADVSTSWYPDAFGAFEQMFVTLQRELLSEKLHKAVLYSAHRTAHSPQLSEIQRWIAAGLKAWERIGGDFYAAWCPDGGWVGISPEVLFCSSLKKGEALTTMALAGTLSEDEGKESDKLLDEHTYVAEEMEQSLCALGEVVVGTRECLQHDALVHLHTPIACRLRRDVSYEEVVRRLHPTPAVGGAPRGASVDFLREMDRISPRMGLGEPFGVLHDGTAKCTVSIRRMQWNRAETLVCAGCGVTRGSDLHREWREVQRKIQTIRGWFV